MIFIPKGICASKIEIELNEEQDTIKSVNFTGGCDGNHQGICRLVEGMKVQDAINRLTGIKCGPRSTSCPDQLDVDIRELKE